MIKILGVVDKIIFRNDENGYTVARFISEGEDLTIVGSCIEIKEAMDYELSGDFIHHKKFGEQFSFEEIKKVLPESKDGMIKYLSSGIIPFIGEKTAKKIVEEFGEDSLRIVEEDTDKLLRVEGIGKGKLKKIKESLADGKELREVMAFLNKYDLGTNLALKVFKEYNTQSIEVVSQNPYKLAEDIQGIGFKKADNIARTMGFENDSSFRKQAALKHTLSKAANDGHAYLPKDELLRETSKLIFINEMELEEEVGKLSLDDKFFIEKRDEEINCYYAPLLKAENYVAGKINELNKYKFKENIDIDKSLEKIEKKQKIEFATNQKLAVKESVDNGVLIITGGPGTGKTTTLKAIIEVFEEMDKKIYLTAPTGRAAKRMKEATGRDASTIHKMLELGFSDSDDNINYGYEEEFNLECDVLIVDEVSMVDLILMNTLLKAVKKGTRLILVGDKDQLPSVGAGNVLSDLIKSEVVKVVNLNEIFRQSEQSMIIKNAHRINNGEFPEFKKDSDFFFIYEKNETKILEIVKDLVNRRLPDYYGFKPQEIQVLAPMRKGTVGVNNLNKNLQMVLNPKINDQTELTISDKTLRLSDKVMQIKNNYNLSYEIDSDFYKEEGEGIFNGDIGYIVDVDSEEKQLSVLFEDMKKIKYDYQDLDELTLSYASTIHKSQGSEFRCVVIPITYAPYLLLTRNLIYTAITRAKELVVLVGEHRFLDIMIKNDNISERYSNLCRKLSDSNV